MASQIKEVLDPVLDLETSQDYWFWIYWEEYDWMILTRIRRAGPTCGPDPGFSLDPEYWFEDHLIRAPEIQESSEKGATVRLGSHLC